MIYDKFLENNITYEIKTRIRANLSGTISLEIPAKNKKQMIENISKCYSIIHRTQMKFRNTCYLLFYMDKIWSHRNFTSKWIIKIVVLD